MAKIETTFIRPKEEFNVDTGKAKVTYDGYQNNPHEIELKENLEGDVEGVINDTFKENDNNNVAFTDNEGNEHELITSEGFGDALNEALPAALANAQVIKTTWSELKALRDGGNLIAGSLYRITDYNCTTTQENTQSAGHQFDIVLLALSANKLAEEGWAMMHDNIYDVTFADGVTKKCYVYEYTEGGYNVVEPDTLKGTSGEIGVEFVSIDDVNKVLICDPDYGPNSDGMENEGLTYNYFQNSNLSAWKVWYCLDNDTARFAWADNGSLPSIVLVELEKTHIRSIDDDTSHDGTDYFAWKRLGGSNIVYTLTAKPNIDDDVYNASFRLNDTVGEFIEGRTEGKGVIYRLIDEWNNDCPYDFKNIQFVRPLTDGELDTSTGTDTWCYTFTGWDGDNSVVRDASFDTGTNHNQIACGDLTILDDVVMIVGDACYFNRCNDVFLCTLNKVTNTELVSCNGVDGIIINAIGIYYYCGDSLSTTEFDDPAIYLNNKKVLTET